jgi:hypothetical protein
MSASDRRIDRPSNRSGQRTEKTVRWNELSRILKIAAVAMPMTIATGTVARAAPITFFGEGGTTASGAAATARANFLAALSAGISTENFESITAGTNTPFSVSFTGGLGTINATLAGTATVLDAPGSGRFATSGTNYVESSPGFNVDFGAQNIAAFGFYGTDIGDFGGQLSLLLDLAGGGTSSLTVPHTIGSGGSTDGRLLFFGIIDTASQFTKVTFNNTDTTDFFGFDDLTVGDIAQVEIPEPLSAALFGFGVLALGIARRRRARAG